MTDTSKYETPDFSMMLGDDGIIRCVWAPGVVVNGELARESQLALQRLGGQTGNAMLADISAIKSMTHEAREIYAAAEGIVAVALLARSPVATVIGNFFIGVKKTVRVPTQIFTTEDKAIAWLKEMMK